MISVVTVGVSSDNLIVTIVTKWFARVKLVVTMSFEMVTKK